MKAGDASLVNVISVALRLFCDNSSKAAIVPLHMCGTASNIGIYKAHIHTFQKASVRQNALSVSSVFPLLSFLTQWP